MIGFECVFTICDSLAQCIKPCWIMWLSHRRWEEVPNTAD